MIVEENKSVKVKIKVSPCIECGSENLDVYDCGYSSFNVAGVKCKDCGHNVQANESWNVTKRKLVTQWNKENSPVENVRILENKITHLQTKIEKIKKLFNI